MKPLSLATSAVVVVALLSGFGSSAIACVTIPTQFPSNRLLTTAGTHLTVPVNAIVWVALVEPEKYTPLPGFPWATPRASDRAVLAPVHLCKDTLVTSLPDEISAFRALRPGTAKLTARLALGWPGSITPRLRPMRSTVTVR